MKVITAVEEYNPGIWDTTCFLAGGITNCPNWQKEVIAELEKLGDTEHLIIFNPRRDNFPINDPNASEEQITWEFNMLERCDIFSMYFCSGESDQPICMYELGRNLALRAHDLLKFDSRLDTVISCEEGYKRKKDVEIQTKLVLKSIGAIYKDFEEDIGTLDLCMNATPKEHAKRIYEVYKNIREQDFMF